MGGARLVETEIRLEASGHHFVGKEVVEHEDVRLFDHLRSSGALGPKQKIGCDRATWSDVGDDQWFELVETGELLVDAGVRVVAVGQGVRELKPASALALVDTLVGLDGRCGTAQVPPRHHIGAGVVIHRFVILIRSDHSVDVGTAIRQDTDPRRPVSSRLHQDSAARPSRDSSSPDQST